MFCRNCGNNLLDNDKFCSNCGLPVKKENPMNPQQQEKQEEVKINKPLEQEGDFEIKIAPPKERFDWNVHTFPGQTPKKTEDTDFDWQVSDDEFRNRPDAGNIAFAPEPTVAPNPFGTGDNEEAKFAEILSPKIPVIDEGKEPREVIAKEKENKDKTSNNTGINEKEIKQSQDVYPRQAHVQENHKSLGGAPREESHREIGNTNSEKLETEKQGNKNVEESITKEKIETVSPEAMVKRETKKSFFKDWFSKGIEKTQNDLEIPDFLASEKQVIQPEAVLEAIAKAKEEEKSNEEKEIKAGETKKAAGVTPVFVGPALAVAGPIATKENINNEKVAHNNEDTVYAIDRSELGSKADIDKKAIEAEMECASFGTPKIAPTVGPKIWHQAATKNPEKKLSERANDREHAEFLNLEEDHREHAVSPNLEEDHRQADIEQSDVQSKQEVQEIEDKNSTHALEQEIFGDEKDTAGDKSAIDIQAAKIDKFYTFNKKNEEFQKLLDQEYEKFKNGGVETVVDLAGEEISTSHEGEEETAIEPPTIVGNSQIQEMARARELFFSEDQEELEVERAEERSLHDYGVQEEQEEDIELIEERTLAIQDGKEASGTPIVGAEEDLEQELKNLYIDKETFGEVKHQTNDSGETKGKKDTNILGGNDDKTKDTVSDDSFWDEEEQGKKAGEKGKKAAGIAVVTLTIVLTLLMLLLAVRFFAPDSQVAKKMDYVTEKIFCVFQGSGENQRAEDGKDRSVPREDKTGLIQLEIEKNMEGLIGAIRYNSSLVHDGQGKYPDEDIKTATKISDNLWYKDEKGQEFYVDQAVVGGVITHCAKIADENKDREKFKVLDIGELRKGEKGYYVWGAEYKTGDDGLETVTQKIYLVTLEEKKAMVSEEFTI